MNGRAKCQTQCVVQRENTEVVRECILYGQLIGRKMVDIDDANRCLRLIVEFRCSALLLTRGGPVHV